MSRIVPVVFCLLGVGVVAPAYADQPPPAPAQSQNRPSPEKGADPVPPNGVINPPPDTGRGGAVTPPNVDPGMTVRPPGTPGGNPNVVPK